MRKLAIALVLGVALQAGGTGGPAASAQSAPRTEVVRSDGAPATTPGGTIPGRHIVVFRDSVADPRGGVDQLAKQHGLKVGHTYASALKGFAAEASDAQMAAVARDPRVQFVAPQRAFGLVADAAPLVTGVDRIEADLSSTRAGDGRGSVDIDVAVIDSGIDPQHFDLNVAGGYNCGTADPTAWADDYGHGTHVAGTIAAKDNGAHFFSSLGYSWQVAGVAPGARVWGVKVGVGDGSITDESLLCGIDWVTANASRIKVVNMSLSGQGSDDGNCGRTNRDAVHLAICKSTEAGVTYVVSAGNEKRDLAVLVPSSYREVLTVTAIADFDGRPGGLGTDTFCRYNYPMGTFADDTPAFFSNYATRAEDKAHTVAAPGVCIFSTYFGSKPAEDRYFYSYWLGTSMASPHAAGTVALCIAKGACRGLTPKQIVAKMVADAKARPAAYGFQGDPNSSDSRRYFGPLIYAGGY